MPKRDIGLEILDGLREIKAHKALPPQTVLIHKLNHLGEEKLAWAGVVLARTATAITVRAPFTRGPLALGYVTLNPGDIFIEHFFADRWYNVYEIYGVETGAFKGWYCNITRPARLTEADVFSEDLALDVFVSPTGATRILDEAEFAALNLAPEEAAHAQAALAQVVRLAAAGALPRAPGKP